MTPSAPTLLLAAVEPSADAIGAALIRSLRERLAPSTRLAGCGGPLMRAEGFESLFPIEPLSVIGALDVLRVAPLAAERASDLARLAAETNAVGAVFIDGWAFSRLAATRFKKRAPSTKLIKYVAPQVWASRPQRVDFVRAHFDGVLTVLPFEPPLFERAGVAAAYVGNPNFEAAARTPADAAGFRERRGVGAAPLALFLLGSRKGEVARLAGPFREAARSLCDKVEGLRLASVIAPAVEAEARAAFADYPGAPVLVGASEKADAFAAADVAVAASGTVSTELAISGAPTVVAYRLDPLSALWVRSVITIPFVSILNVAAGEAVIPELLQERCAGPDIAQAALSLLTDPGARRAQRQALHDILPTLGLGGPPAAMRAARQIADWIGAPAFKEISPPDRATRPAS